MEFQNFKYLYLTLSTEFCQLVGYRFLVWPEIENLNQVTKRLNAVDGVRLNQILT